MVVHVKTTIERQSIQSIIGIGLSEEFQGDYYEHSRKSRLIGGGE